MGQDDLWPGLTNIRRCKLLILSRHLNKDDTLDHHNCVGVNQVLGIVGSPKGGEWGPVQKKTAHPMTLSF